MTKPRFLSPQRIYISRARCLAPVSAVGKIVLITPLGLPKKKKKRDQPLSISPEFSVLAEKTKANIIAVVKELRDELSRMAGRVVNSDHNHFPSSRWIIDYRKQYSLQDDVIKKEVRENLKSLKKSK